MRKGMFFKYSPMYMAQCNNELKSERNLCSRFRDDYNRDGQMTDRQRTTTDNWPRTKSHAMSFADSHETRGKNGNNTQYIIHIS